MFIIKHCRVESRVRRSLGKQGLGSTTKSCERQWRESSYLNCSCHGWGYIFYS